MATQYSSIAQRIINGENEFIETIMAFGKVSREEAITVFGVYRKLKVIKRDAGSLKYSVKHGAFLEKEIIENALTTA